MPVSPCLDFFERLVRAGVVRKADEASARRVVAGLDADPGRTGAPSVAVAEALLRLGAITDYQAEKVRREKIDDLLYGSSYVIVERLGRGGMGEVYRAWQKIFNRVDALKVIQAGPLQSNPEALARFLREAELLGRIDHPHVVRARHADYCEKNDQYYLAMECIDGPNLQDWVVDRLKRSKPLNLDHACGFIRHAALGLGRIHEAGIVHRDIKPANLILAPDGIVKVLDMGLARLAADASADVMTELTHVGQVLGTAPYMAPEQCEDPTVADARSDIYSLGCALYFFCVGDTMFGPRCKRNVGCYYNAHQNVEAPALRSSRPDAPSELEAIYRKMVAKRPEDRFQKMTEVAAALKAISGSRTNLASQPQPAPKPKPKPAPPVPAPQAAPPPPPPSAVSPTVISSPAAPPSGDFERVLDSILHEASFEGRKPGETRNDNGLKMPMVWCPPGTFRMGSPPSEPNRDSDEGPVTVRLTQGFWIGKYAVTQSEWSRLMGENPSWFSPSGGGKDKVKGMDTSRFPVETVSWEDAMAFCRKWTEQERTAGRLPAEWEYTLPTEAQWEYACRAGTTTATAFGDRLSSTQANFDGNYPYNGAAKGPYLRRTTEVGSYAGNGWGLCDMHGNVWEWCRDWKGVLQAGDDPTGPASASDRVLRGGDWDDFGQRGRSSLRSSNTPSHRFNQRGFRVSISRSR